MKGIVVDLPWTNVVFDLMLAGIGQITGFAAAETIAATIAVLVFFWGTFALIARINGRPCWTCVPLLLVLTYGLIFRLGFFNFYLATGLSAAAAAIWRFSSWPRVGMAIVLAVSSVCANPIPIAYVVGSLAYSFLLQHLDLRSQISALIATGLGLIALGRSLIARFPSAWSWDRLFPLPAPLSFFGLDQLWLYNDRYCLLGLGTILVVLVGALAHYRCTDRRSNHSIVHLIAINIVLMTSFPHAIQFPAHHAPLSFVPERISLFSAILVCCLVAKLPVHHWIHGASAIICLVFFALTYRDDLALTRFSIDVQRAVDSVPVGSRVVASLVDPEARLNPLLHLVDRACLGQCFSYANYEPSTASFRVKAIDQNTIVMASTTDIGKVQDASFIVGDRDAPVYAVCNCKDLREGLCAVPLQIGERMCSVRAVVTGR